MVGAWGMAASLVAVMGAVRDENRLEEAEK